MAGGSPLIKIMVLAGFTLVYSVLSMSLASAIAVKVNEIPGEDKNKTDAYKLSAITAGSFAGLAGLSIIVIVIGIFAM